MKSVALALTFAFYSAFAIGQSEMVKGSVSQQPLTNLKKHQSSLPSQSIPVLTFQKPDVAALLAEDKVRSEPYRFGTAIEVDITPQNSGVWHVNDKGDRIWQLKIHQPDALALSFIFSEFDLKGASYINVYNERGKKVHKTYTKKDVLATGQQNLSLCAGDLLTIELVEPEGSPASTLKMEKLFYAYRSYGELGYTTKIGESEACQVNVNCPEGNNWQDEKKGVARILMVIGGGQYLCSGSLVNNTDEDCKPYFLTAMHCAENANQNDFNQWRFYFNFESPGCYTPSSSQVPDQYITGGERLAGSDDVNGNTIAKSDFFLMRLGTVASESSIISTLKSYGAYWNGWNANNTASTGGVGIHHPSGDIKKISTYTQTLQSASYSGINSNTHWVTYWTATSSGHGVTEGGSSGSPLFTYNGGNSHIVGTLSGGSSYCSTPNNPDLYGKVSYHWASAGSNNNTQLKPWLDPGNTGVKVLDGSADPCNGGTGGGTPNPGVCQPDPGQCDEYIANVSLASIDNTTNCDGYTDYSNLSATLVPGNTYQIGVTPGVIGHGAGTFYTGDVIGVWVDWSGNGDFSNPNEEIVIEQLTQNSPASYNLTVPSNVSSGTYVMRVRITYDATNGGNISPCADTDYGEIEDYRIVVGNGGGTPSSNEYDLEVMLSNPASLSAVIPSTDQNVSFSIKNNGPDAISAGDTLWFAYTHVDNATQQETIYSIATGATNAANGVILSAELAPGQTLNSSQLGTDLSNASINTSSFQNGDQIHIWCLGSAYSVNDLLPSDPNDLNNSNNTDYFVIDAQGGGTSSVMELNMNTIGLYPNPTTGEVTVDLKSIQEKLEIAVYDLTGKVVFKQTQKNVDMVTIDFSMFEAGVYQVAVKTEQGKVIKKVIKR